MTNRFALIAARLRAHQHFILILGAFLTFRVILPFAFRTGSFFRDSAPDLGAYADWGTLADSHLYPFINYWSEYPPLFAWSVVGIYRISTLLPAWLDQRLWFSIVMQLTMVLFDTGSLLVVYGLGLQLGSKTKALRIAALFASAFVFAYAASGWYEPIPLFFLLLALYLTLRNRFTWSALAAGVGLMTKIIPILIVPIALQRITRWRARLGYLLVVTATAAGIMLPFWIANRDNVLAFVRSTLNRPSWLSIWAVLEGRYGWGEALPLIDRFSPDNVGVAPVSSLPWPLIHLAFAGLLLFLYTRRIDWRDPLKSVAFAGITISLFFIWSKGFSGQFTAYLVPFIILTMPNLRGVFYMFLLSLLWIGEEPIVYTVLDGRAWFIAWLVIARTAVLIALCFEYAALIFPPFSIRLARLATVIAVITGFSVVPIGLAAVNTYSQTQITLNPATPALDFIQAQSKSSTPLMVFAEAYTSRSLYAAARQVGDVWVVPDPDKVPEDRRVSWLDSLTAQGWLWFIADESDPAWRDEDTAREQWMSAQSCKVDTQLVGSARISRFVGLGPAPIPIRATAVFSNQIQLLGAHVSDSVLRANGTLCVELDWRTLQTPQKSYAVDVRVVDERGTVVAQNTMKPQGGFAVTKQWRPGATVADKHGLILPDNLPSGEYTLEIDVQLTSDGSSVSVTQTDQLLLNSGGIVLTKMKAAP